MSVIVELKKSGTHQYLTGHPWIYASEISSVKGDPNPRETVRVKDGWGRWVGSGLISPKSEIRVRLFTREARVMDSNLIRERFIEALKRRKDQDCNRLVWSEADGLPGLVVDRYNTVVVFQILHAGMEAWRQEIIESIEKVFQPEVIIERSDASVRSREGLASRIEVVKGIYSEPSFHQIGEVKMKIDLLKGQKTGAYLDQSENYLAVATLAQGKRVLDCFANRGGFGLHCAKAGAQLVDAVESSEEAVKEGEANALLNEVKLNWIQANVFDWLRQAVMTKKQYDLIILDPPSFTRTRHNLKEALRGYKEIHVRALQLLTYQGILTSYCCSHHVTLECFEKVIREAAGDVKRSLILKQRHFQSSDHPILLGMPETEYLKGVVLEAT